MNAGGTPRGGVQGPLTAEQVQQFTREAQQRLGDAEALRQELARQGLPTAELDRAIDQLRQLTNPQALASSSKALQTQLVNGLKDFEFGLRRALGASDSANVLLDRTGDVPPAYRQNVEEYYRAIGRGTEAPKPPTPGAPPAP